MKPSYIRLSCGKQLVFFLLVCCCNITTLAQPSNDDCSGAYTRSSSTSCSNTQYSIDDATPSTGIPVGCASGGTHYDIWFRFVASNATHTVTFSSLESGITNPEVQIFSGSCASLTSLVCGTTTATATGLTIGNTYYIRFSNVGSAVTANAQFEMCITHPNTPPANDECAGSVLLTSETSCNNTQRSIRYATATAGLPAGCEAPGVHYDIWFRFVAASVTHTVTISNRESSFNNPAVQLYSGACGSLTSLVCGTTSVTGTGLTIGNTYYVRISNIGSYPTSSQTDFDICVTHPPSGAANDFCANATLLTSNFACTATTGNLRYATSGGPAGACGGATATTTYEVWYRFQAVHAQQTITVNSLGSNLTAASTYMELLNGTCGSFTSLGCQAASVTSGRMTVAGLTVGTFYYARVYVLLSPTATPTSGWNFNICVQHPPANDECAGAVVLTPGATCTNTAGTLDLATLNAATPIGCFPAGNYYDVWYRFTATAVTHTVSLSGLGSSFTAPRIQIYSGGCGALVSVGCSGTTSLTQGGLTIGNIYYVRIANFTTNPSGVGTVANFNICITAAAAPPANDLCPGTTLLGNGSTCSFISGTLINATATAGVPACGNAASPDVWYRFVAQTAYPVITLGNIGANLLTASPRIQLLSGAACGLFTSLACQTVLASPTSLNTAVTPGGAGLIVGNTYYIRITTNNLLATVTTGTYTFGLCVVNPTGAVLDYAKSYINITDGTAGGTIDPGDVLEIRATIVVQRGGSPLALRAIDSVAFFDTLKVGSGLTYVNNSMALRTNEGKLFHPTVPVLGYYNDAADAVDQAWLTTGGPGTDTALRINMGLGATRFARGKYRSNSRPSNFNVTCIILATYRVTVNAGYGSTINFGGGAFTFRDSVTGVLSVINFPNDSIRVFQSPGSCQNSVAQTNILGDEFNGTFGTASGSPSYPQNRGTSSNTNYLYLPFSASTPNDYYYGIANNTSAAGTTNQFAAKPNAARVFNLWDITGDHTGATNTARGNLPCNLSTPISLTNPCGYMLIINSAYQTDTAFQFSVNGACPNTYYEISGWFKNICYKCGCDSVGRSSTTAGYIPTAPGDSAGVRPNIAIEINGTDYYTTGDLVYQGLGGTQTGSDTLNNWVQRSFVYQTGPAETGFTITLRNNAPGGGGNDWALDDITLKTCLPNMNYSPSNAPMICEGNILVIYDTVRCYYNTYIYYKWQRSTNGGSTWTDVAGSSGIASPYWNGTEWEYVASYTIPPAYTTSGNDGDLYRLVVATTAANLSSSTCNFTDPLTIALDVLLDCGPPLSTRFLSVSGKLNTDIATVLWTTSKEEEPVRYTLERSEDAVNFRPVATINGHNSIQSEKNHYSYTDPTAISGKTYYRVLMTTASGYKKYSRVILLTAGEKEFGLRSVVNPFAVELYYEIISAYAGAVKTELIDQFGRTIKTEIQQVIAGVNSLNIPNCNGLPAGVYVLKVTMKDKVAVRRVVKENN